MRLGLHNGGGRLFIADIKFGERTVYLLAVVEVQRLHVRRKLQLCHVACDRWKKKVRGKKEED